MANEELSLRIKVINASKDGFNKTISEVRNFTRKASGIVKSGFRSMRPTVPKARTGKALMSLRRFASKAKSIVKNAFSKMALNIRRPMGGIVRSITRGVRNSIIALGGFSIWTVKTASDAEELESKFAIVFGDMTQTMLKWTAEYGKAARRSKFDLMEWASGIQDLLVPMGFARKEAARLTRQFVKFGVDLASQKNIKPEVMFQKIQSGLTGMYRPLTNVGIALNDMDVKQEAVSLGLAKTTKEVDRQAKVYAQLSLMLKRGKDAEDDAILTRNSVANQILGMLASFKEFRIEIGKQIIAGSVLGGLIGKISSKFETFTSKIKDTGIIKTWAEIAIKWLGEMYEKLKPLLTSMADLFSQDKEKRTKAIEDVKTKFVKVAVDFGTIVGKILLRVAKRMAIILAEGLGLIKKEPLPPLDFSDITRDITSGKKTRSTKGPISNEGARQSLGGLSKEGHKEVEKETKGFFKKLSRLTGKGWVALGVALGAVYPALRDITILTYKVGKRFRWLQRTLFGVSTVLEGLRSKQLSLKEAFKIFRGKTTLTSMGTGKVLNPITARSGGLIPKLGRGLSKPLKALTGAGSKIFKGISGYITKGLAPLLKVISSPLGKLLGKVTLVLGFLLDIYTILTAIKDFFKMRKADKSLRKSMEDLRWQEERQGVSTGELKRMRKKQNANIKKRLFQEEAFAQLKRVNKDFDKGILSYDKYQATQEDILEILRIIDKDLGAQ